MTVGALPEFLLISRQFSKTVCDLECMIAVQSECTSLCFRVYILLELLLWNVFLCVLYLEIQSYDDDACSDVFSSLFCCCCRRLISSWLLLGVYSNSLLCKKKFFWGLLLVLAKTVGGMELHHGRGMHMMMHVEYAAWLLMAAALTAKCLAMIALSVLSQILHS